MPFAFPDRDEPVSKSVRRLARNRMEASLALVADADRPLPERIRELRKNIKKTRALIRLVRPNFKGFDRENDALRKAAAVIADLRDNDALAEAFDAVARRVYVPFDAREALRARILKPLPSPEVEGDATGAGATGAEGASPVDAALAEHARLVQGIAERARGWKIGATGFDALAPGLERTWSAAQKAMRQSQAEPTGLSLHQWRKRAKDHWYHARLLAPVWPEMMAHHVAAADALGERLGEARDLAFLIEALTGAEGGEDFIATARQEEDRLLDAASTLGTRFFSEPAQGLSRRWRGWWEIWRA
ncbi:CHAD domain-containing protein [Albidovulum sp.]|uniref:CHAD domain-containing protein n=1 Tax=Albidovulum sp. TaxID=1872424 RepID=UPI001DF8D1CF|nr:CHAD domain-containing protein [Paracoccaceae bacterium]HPE24032.1 CHAD domain-containing protein [Albidovulum sp.]MCB2143262.1 CHAD domain-containing protein [Paracoccaceae bacterium]MCP5354272.1 CHAD domain-containing protein [Paracoccaceae bacterium]MCP5375991.1 CHAD domain-containing protein [Paracoccaceae bacterium]